MRNSSDSLFSNGVLPTRISYKQQPRANMSLSRSSWGTPRARSGLRREQRKDKRRGKMVASKMKTYLKYSYRGEKKRKEEEKDWLAYYLPE